MSKNNIAKKKGISMLDFMIAAGFFLFVFAFLVNYMTGYMTTPKGTSDVARLRSEAFSLLSIADRGAEPANWPELKSDSSTVLLMHFNNNTLDYSGLGNNGTNYGANCSLAVAGRFYSACSFDGVDDYVNVSDSNSLDISGQLTVEAWVYPKSFSKQCNILCKGDGNNAYNYCLYLDVDTGDIYLGGGTYPFTSFNPNLNQWNHIAVTFNGINALFYLNGILVDTKSGSLGDINDFPLYIGYNNYGVQ